MLTRRTIALALPLALAGAGGARADLPETIAAVKRGLVGIGTFQATRRPPAELLGTGFAVADGRHALTSLHVVNDALDKAKRERIVVFAGAGDEAEQRGADVAAADPVHDAAVLAIDGPPLVPLRLSPGDEGIEGEEIAFTGFPLGGALGLHPVTHRGIISAWTPITAPVVDPRQLTTAMIKQLAQGPFHVYQLDATAYPGNSGSPLYRPADGVVLGIVSSVFVKGSKETAITDPSGITYAIPIRWGRDLLLDLGLAP